MRCAGAEGHGSSSRPHAGCPHAGCLLDVQGQTEGQVELTPGKHTLTMQFANALHKSYGPGYAKSIEVMVKKP